LIFIKFINRAKLIFFVMINPIFKKYINFKRKIVFKMYAAIMRYVYSMCD